jgi:MOSC domain-containing protein YiiM
MSAAPAARVAAISLCVGAAQPMLQPAEARARADFGLEGDRHAKAGSERQVLLVDAAVLVAEGLKPGGIRENLTIDGMAVDGLKAGTRLRVGAEVVLRVTKICEPCHVMDKIQPGLQARLKGRRGILTSVESGGAIRVGDAVAPIAG